MKLRANGIEIEVDDSGGDGPVVLLIMGLGMQLIAWPQTFVKALVDAGFRVVRHDNRDSGLSQGFDHAGTGNLVWQGVRQRLGLPVRSAYHLQHMADDALGVLDALGVGRAHVVGASMGGMIAQRLAATAPTRVTSLVSIMSSSGARGLPGPRPEVTAALLRRPRKQDEAALVAHSLGLLRLIGSPAYREDEGALAARLGAALRRAYRPAGIVRQLLAIGADADRPAVLARIACPTLVIHGEADPLVPIACGRDTARRIAGAQFIAVPGMGHDVPPQVERILIGHMLPFLRAAQEKITP
ncbi:MAG: alpha/beta hydrolase [Variovorax sp.]|nr:alpha/beta hydrolase [Variovorax sp.]